MTDKRPVLFVTNHVPPDRVGAFAVLHHRTPIELALFGGRSWHATEGVENPGVPHRFVSQREVGCLAASGRYRAVISGTAGRVALPLAWLGARRARVPFILWTALWAHPRTPAHLAGTVLMHTLYRRADAVATYGPHVSAFVKARGARRVVEAPQAVDHLFWEQPGKPARPAEFVVTFVGRPNREKGIRVLEAAWRVSRFAVEGSAALVLAGVDAEATRLGAGGAVFPLGAVPPTEVRNILAGTDVVVVPSLRTRWFREPWGLVVNEALHQRCVVIASDEVGAAAGGLIVDGQTGIVFPSDEPAALARALVAVRDDADLRTKLAQTGHAAVQAYTYEAWADGMARAVDLGSVR